MGAPRGRTGLFFCLPGRGEHLGGPATKWGGRGRPAGHAAVPPAVWRWPLPLAGPRPWGPFPPHRGLPRRPVAGPFAASASGLHFPRAAGSWGYVSVLKFSGHRSGLDSSPPSQASVSHPQAARPSPRAGLLLQPQRHALQGLLKSSGSKRPFLGPRAEACAESGFAQNRGVCCAAQEGDHRTSVRELPAANSLASLRGGNSAKMVPVVSNRLLWGTRAVRGF
jgi:hypothetical protein